MSEKVFFFVLWHVDEFSIVRCTIEERNKMKKLLGRKYTWRMIVGGGHKEKHQATKGEYFIEGIRAVKEVCGITLSVLCYSLFFVWLLLITSLLHIRFCIVMDDVKNFVYIRCCWFHELLILKLFLCFSE